MCTGSSAGLQGTSSEENPDWSIGPAPRHRVIISPCLCSCFPANALERQHQEMRSKPGKEDLTLHPRNGLKYVVFENRIQ